MTDATPKYTTHADCGKYTSLRPESCPLCRTARTERLNAAAPDLLAALEAVHGMSFPESPAFREAWKMVDAAIAKARGA